ncbi:hypothetical protein IWX49DRAFT_383763 [Phyllosticta citricarpa]|uniref:Uncharacterized protein n=1 Tax=Phyllosticta citricarpa TaxID=55181 RepID=A0ABR1L5A6_9PEZI
MVVTDTGSFERDIYPYSWSWLMVDGMGGWMVLRWHGDEWLVHVFLLSISIFSFLTLSLFSLFLTFPYLFLSYHFPSQFVLPPFTSSQLAIWLFAFMDPASRGLIGEKRR